VHLHLLQTFEELGNLALQPKDKNITDHSRDRDRDRDYQMLEAGGWDGGRGSQGRVSCRRGRGRRWGRWGSSSWQGEAAGSTEFSPVVREPLLAAQRVMHRDAGAVEGAQRQLAPAGQDVCPRGGPQGGRHPRQSSQAKALQDPLAAVEEAKLLWGAGASYQGTHRPAGHAPGVPRGHPGGDDVSMAIWGAQAVQLPPRTRWGPVCSGLGQEMGAGLWAGAASLADRARVARSLPPLARWSHATGQRRKAQLQVLFGQQAEKVLQPAWEKGFFHFAKYLDDLMQDARQRQRRRYAGPGWGYKPAEDQRGAWRWALAVLLPVRAGAKSLIEDDKPWWTYLRRPCLTTPRLFSMGTEICLRPSRGCSRCGSSLGTAAPRGAQERAPCSPRRECQGEAGEAHGRKSDSEWSKQISTKENVQTQGFHQSFDPWWWQF